MCHCRKAIVCSCLCAAVIGFKTDFLWSHWKPVPGLCLNDEDRAIVPDQLYLVTFSAVAMVRPEVAEAIIL
jgi:hypothetical protein